MIIRIIRDIRVYNKDQDGRQIIVPVSMFPDIKEMSLKHRNEWMILDHQYFTFEHMTRIYSILDIMNVTKPAA